MGTRNILICGLELGSCRLHHSGRYFKVRYLHTRRRDQFYPDIVVDNIKLQVATKQKYLGLMFDSTLSWSGFTYMSEDGLLSSFD